MVMGKKIAIVLILLFINHMFIYAQSNHNRIDIQKEYKNHVIVGLELNNIYYEIDSFVDQYLESTFHLGYMYLNKIFFNISIPILLKEPENIYITNKRILWMYCNPSVSFGLLFKTSSFKYVLESKYTYLNSDLFFRRINRTYGYGSIYNHAIELSFGILKVIDPVILNCILRYSFLMPSGNYDKFKNNYFNFELSYIEVLNDIIGLNLGLEHYFLYYQQKEIYSQLQNEKYYLSIFGAIMFYLRDADLRIGIEKELTQIRNELITSFNVFYDFKF